MKEKRDERLEMKKNGKGKSSEAETIKLVLNSLVGKYKSNFSFLKDDLANLQVTLTGQLCLCILVERLWLMKFKVISLNT